MPSYKQYTDTELLHLLKDDNVDAFSEIYFRHAEHMYRQTYKALRNREEAQDIIQNIFTSLWKKRAEINISNLAAYLFIANRNQLIKIIAHKKITSDYFSWLQTVIDEELTTADSVIREKQLQELIEQEVSKLPSKMRVVFNLSRKAHLSHKEIAVKLDLSEATVKTQVKNALKILRTKLKPFFSLILLLSSFLF